MYFHSYNNVTNTHKTYNVSTSSHCAQQVITINKAIVVKSVLKTVVMVIRIEQS